MTERPLGPGAQPASHAWTLVDGHLDLAYNALDGGRDLTLPLDELRRRESLSAKQAMVTLPELVDAGIALVVATLFVLPSRHADQPGRFTYDDAAQAHALATRQLDLYERWEDEGRIRIVRSRGDLDAHLAREAGGAPAVVLLIEGADPILAPDRLSEWVARGVRMVAPAWKGTRYAGGTGEPGPLTPAGEELVAALDEHKVVLDVSHLAEESFWQALELHAGSVVASHSNARALVDSDRQLSDAMLRALGARGATVGIVLGDRFLRDDGDGGTTLRREAQRTGRSPVTLADVGRHAGYLAGFVGWESVGIGSDLDGGFGRLETPAELDRGADFARLAEAVPAEHRASFVGGAWLAMLERALPSR